MKILVVEEDSEVREMLLHMLKGHQLWSTGSRCHALHIIAREDSPFDVVLANAGKGFPGGVELLQTVRGMLPNTRCILMSGNPLNAEAAVALGVDFLPKPFYQSELRKMLALDAAECGRV